MNFFSECENGRAEYDTKFNSSLPWCVFVRGTHICCVATIEEVEFKFQEYNVKEIKCIV